MRPHSLVAAAALPLAINAALPRQDAAGSSANLTSINPGGLISSAVSDATSVTVLVSSSSLLTYVITTTSTAGGQGYNGSTGAITTQPVVSNSTATSSPTGVVAAAAERPALGGSVLGLIVFSIVGLCVL